MTGPRSRIARHKTKKQHNLKKERRASARITAARRDPKHDHAAEVAAWMAGRTPEQQSALRALAKLIGAAAPRAEHRMRWAYLSWVQNGDVCYVSAHARHVNLGFHRGAELTDPTGLLEGTGKGMRHVKLAIGEPLPAAALTSLVREAVKLDARG